MAAQQCAMMSSGALLGSPLLYCTVLCQYCQGAAASPTSMISALCKLHERSSKVILYTLLRVSSYQRSWSVQITAEAGQQLSNVLTDMSMCTTQKPSTFIRRIKIYRSKITLLESATANKSLGDRGQQNNQLSAYKLP
jgi:hypothetical protein